MSHETPSPEPTPHDVPEILRAAVSHADWRIGLHQVALTLALDFARQFRLQPEDAVATLLMTVSHCLGESLQVELPHGVITPPFNLLAITPETHPMWTGVPLRFLSSGIGKHVEHRLSLQRVREQTGKQDEAAAHAVLYEQWAQQANESAGLQMLRQIADTVVCDQVRPPFVRPPLDRAVSLTTPRRGLLKTLGELSPLERVCLEDSLLGVRCIRDGNPAPGPPARPSFFWHLPKAQACAFFRQHGCWLQGVPFVMMHCRETGFPNLDVEATAVLRFDRLSEIVFGERHARSGKPRVFRLEAEVAKPVMKFIDEVARRQSKGEESASFQWVADLGLKFAMILLKLEESKKLDVRLVKNGLELAKFYARRRIEFLSAFDLGQAADSAETADLDDRERRAFLKICESGGITRADLRKTFHEMTAAERDVIVARLIELGLIRAEGRLLRRNAA